MSLLSRFVQFNAYLQNKISNSSSICFVSFYSNFKLYAVVYDVLALRIFVYIHYFYIHLPLGPQTCKISKRL